jgi:hypothetical protein
MERREVGINEDGMMTEEEMGINKFKYWQMVTIMDEDKDEEKGRLRLKHLVKLKKPPDKEFEREYWKKLRCKNLQIS